MGCWTEKSSAVCLPGYETMRQLQVFKVPTSLFCVFSFRCSLFCSKFPFYKELGHC